MTFKKFALATAVAVPAVLVSLAPASAQRLPAPVMAVVDTDKLMSECNACKAATTQLQAQAQQVQQFAKQLDTPLQTEAQSLETAIKAANGKPDAALQTRIGTFQGKQQDANRQVQEQQATFQRNVAYVRQQIGQKLGPIIDQVAQQRGASVAVDTNAVLYSAPALDITDAVMTALNAQLATVNVVAPPPAQQPAQGAAATPAKPQSR